MIENISAEKMADILKKEKEELLNKINTKIKKKKSFTEPQTRNQFLK